MSSAIVIHYSLFNTVIGSETWRTRDTVKRACRDNAASVLAMWLSVNSKKCSRRRQISLATVEPLLA